MRIVVTGGAGFIGSHLCEKLLQTGHEVICIDSFISGIHRNIEPFLKDPHFRLLEHDITVPIKEDLGEIQQIYNLASPASPADYQQIPLQTLWTNAAGTKQMLEIASKRVVPFLLASTSEIYGDPLEHPQKETYFGNVNPVSERSCYSEGKRYAESMAMVYYRDFRFPLKIVRIFNTYGPRMRKHDGRVMPEFIQAALREEPLRVNGDGLQTRSFCYVDDLVEGLILAMGCQEFLGPMNLGNPQETTIMDVAKKVVELTVSSSLISTGMPINDDPRRRQPDITLARTKLGFEPKVSLEEGLKRTIAYFKG